MTRLPAGRNGGRFIWYDVMTTDRPAAAAVYGAVLGWTTADSRRQDGSYTLFSTPHGPAAGLMSLHAGAPPCWTGYIGVDDVEDTVTRALAAGGSLDHGPETIPGIGRFAVVADPHGARFVVFTWQEGRAPQPPPPTLGHVQWHELYAGEREAAFTFYAALFGWTKEQAIDTGPMGLYQTFGQHGGPAFGGMITRMPSMPGPFWLFYFATDAIDAAAARVTAQGGRVMTGPMQVPTGSWIIHCLDPQGALFALIAPAR